MSFHRRVSWFKQPVKGPIYHLIAQGGAMQVIYYKKTVISTAQLNAQDTITLLAAQGPHTFIHPIDLISEWSLGDTTEVKSDESPFYAKYDHGDPTDDMVGAWPNATGAPLISPAQSEFRPIDIAYAATVLYDRDVNKAILLTPGGGTTITGTTGTLTIHMYYSLIATTI